MSLSYITTVSIVSRGAPPAQPAPTPAAEPPAAAPPSETFAEAMKAAWGLEVKQQKLPMPVVVIDRLELPSAN